MELSKAIKEVRKRKGLTQNELASRLEITQSYLSTLEGGHKHPSIPLLQRISEECDFPIPILMYLSLSESDVPKRKRGIFRSIDPHIREMIKDIFSN
jgi:transcriptional regulator with XRE-family HTH domain